MARRPPLRTAGSEQPSNRAECRSAHWGCRVAATCTVKRPLLDILLRPKPSGSTVVRASDAQRGDQQMPLKQLHIGAVAGPLKTWEPRRLIRASIQFTRCPLSQSILAREPRAFLRGKRGVRMALRDLATPVWNAISFRLGGNMKLNHIPASTALAILLTCSTPAAAHTLLLPLPSAYAWAGDEYGNGSEKSGSSGVSATFSNTNYYAYAYAFPPSSSIGAFASGAQYTGAASSLSYEFEVNGPPNTEIPLIVQAAGFASYSGDTDGYADAYVSINGAGLGGIGLGAGGGYASASELCPNGPGATPGNCSFVVSDFATTYEADVESDTPINVFMYAEAFSDGPTAFFSAGADPYFRIDPTFATADQYAIVTSPGVGNSPLGATSIAAPAPEAATWILMLAGLGGLGAMMRGTRRRSGAAAA